MDPGLLEVALDECLAPRLWHFLTAPADLPCRAVLPAWRRAATAPASPLSSPAVPHGGSGTAPLGAAPLRPLRSPRVLVPHIRLEPLHLEQGSGTTRRYKGETKLKEHEVPAVVLWMLHCVVPHAVKTLDVCSERMLEFVDLLELSVQLGVADWVGWILSSSYGKCMDLPTQVDVQGFSWRLAFPGFCHGGSKELPLPDDGHFSKLLQRACGEHGPSDAAVVPLLLRARADMAYVDENGGTALHHAAMNGRAAACDVLLAAGAAVNPCDDDEWTPLSLAADAGHLECCRLLLQHRANVNARDEDGLTPIDRAIICKHRDVVELLVTSGGRGGRRTAS